MDTKKWNRFKEKKKKKTTIENKNVIEKNQNEETLKKNEKVESDIMDFGYLRFRKLTFEVKLVLKLEKFSVLAFSCNTKVNTKWIEY